jgi:ribosomal protein S18 acetylase RimI-like enzyme
MTTRIRPARATDVPFLGWVMLAASRGHLARGAWDVYVGGDDERQVLGLLEQLACQTTRSFCCWDGFLVAEVDGTPAAALSGYDPGAPGMANPDPAIVEAAGAALGWREAERQRADARLEPFVTCVTVPPPQTWVVEWVATDPGFRRRGVVHELLLAIVEAGRRRGFRRSQITLFIGNSAAQAAYERVGYAIADEKRHPQFERLIGSPGLARMTRNL